MGLTNPLATIIFVAYFQAFIFLFKLINNETFLHHEKKKKSKLLCLMEIISVMFYNTARALLESQKLYSLLHKE